MCVIKATHWPLNPRQETRYLLYRRLCKPQGQYGRVREISPPPKFNPRTIQRVASCYTDWAISTQTTVVRTTSTVYFQQYLHHVSSAYQYEVLKRWSLIWKNIVANYWVCHPPIYKNTLQFEILNGDSKGENVLIPKIQQATSTWSYEAFHNNREISVYLQGPYAKCL
jgi:hypothetical protein